MDGIYPKILKQAFALAKDNKIFWKAGLFLSWPNIFRSLIFLGFLATWLRLDLAAAPLDNGQAAQQANPWIGLGMLLFIGLFVILYFRHKTAVVLAVKHLLDTSKVEDKKIYRESDPYLVSSARFSFAAAAVLGIITGLLAFPVFYLQSGGFTIRAEILGVFAAIVFIPIFGLICCTMVFVPMFLATYNLSVTDGVRASADILRRNWLFLLGLAAILLAVEIIGLAGSLALTFLASQAFVLLAGIFYDAGSSAAPTVVQGLAGLLGFMVFFMSQGLVAVFQRIVWAVAFFEIIRPLKSDEDEQPETIPEVI